MISQTACMPFFSYLKSLFQNGQDKKMADYIPFVLQQAATVNFTTVKEHKEKIKQIYGFH